MAPSRTPRSAPRDPRLVALAEDSGYEILDRIGAGGMGIVYRAKDADGNDVAIKLLRHEISDDARARERLSREVASQKLVRNDNIVRILDAELESSEAFVVTEFIPGPTLEDAVRTHGGLHPEAVREIGLVMGETLRDIHDAGVIHRDLKPSNIMLRGAIEEDLAGFDPEGDRLDPVIIDFGIAIAAETSRLTSTGLVMGTATYLDPEVIRTNHTDEATDWWAWAALLSFAATGREPYGTGRADVVFLRADRGELDIEGVPTELAAWLRSALQSRPEQRPEPAEMLAGLAELDLSRFDDPGETEALSAGQRTSVLPAGGAAAAGAGSGHAAGAADGTAPLAAADGSAPDGGGTVARADAAPEVAGRDGSGAEEGATTVLPAGGGVGASVGDEPRTEVLPPVTTPPEQPTEAIPRITTPNEPVTEALPVHGTPTRALPVVPPQEAPQQQPMAQDPRRPGATAPTPQREYAPQHAPAPQQGHPYPGPHPAQQVAQAPPAWDPSAPPTSQGQMVPQGQMAMQGQAGPYGPWPQPPPRRPLLVWIGHLLIISLGAVAPYVSLTALLLLGALARTWERSHQAVAGQRLRGATGAGPSWRAGLASPFRFLLGLLEIALQALFPLVLGLLVGIAVDAGWTLLQGSAPPDAVTFGLAMAITLLITWVGLGSRTTRNGAHRMLDAAAPDMVWGAVVLGLLLLLLGAVVFTLLAREGMVDYFPFPDGPRLTDIAVWRR